MEELGGLEIVERFHSKRRETMETSLKELSDFHSSLFSTSISFISHVTKLLISCVNFLEKFSKSVIARLLVAFALPFALGFALVVFLLCGVFLTVIHFCSLGMDLIKRQT